MPYLVKFMLNATAPHLLSEMTKNGFSDCKAAERGGAAASLGEANAADGNPDKLLG